MWACGSWPRNVAADGWVLGGPGPGPFWDLSHQLLSGHTLASGDPPSPRDVVAKATPSAANAGSTHCLPARPGRGQRRGRGRRPGRLGWGCLPGSPPCPSHSSSTRQGSIRSRGALGIRACSGHSAQGSSGTEDGSHEDHTGQRRPGRQRLGLRTSASALRVGRLLEVSATFHVDTALSRPASISTKPDAPTADLHAPQQRAHPSPSADAPPTPLRVDTVHLEPEGGVQTGSLSVREQCRAKASGHRRPARSSVPPVTVLRTWAPGHLGRPELPTGDTKGRWGGAPRPGGGGARPLPGAWTEHGPGRSRVFGPEL